MSTDSKLKINKQAVGDSPLLRKTRSLNDQLRSIIYYDTGFHLQCSFEYDNHRFEDYNSEMKLKLTKLVLEREDPIIKHSQIRENRKICVSNEDTVSANIPTRETEMKIEEHEEVTFSTTISATIEKGESHTSESAANFGVQIGKFNFGGSVAQANGNHSIDRKEHGDTKVRGVSSIRSETTKVPSYNFFLEPGTRGCIQIFTNETGRDSHYLADFEIDDQAELDFFKFQRLPSAPEFKNEYGEICTIVKGEFQRLPTIRFLEFIMKHVNWFGAGNLRHIAGKYYLKRVPVTITTWTKDYYTTRLERVYIQDNKPVTTTEFPDF